MAGYPHARSVAAVIFSTFSVSAAYAQNTDSNNTNNNLVDISECVNIASPDERFACYERLAQGSKAEEVSVAPEALPEPVPEPVASVVSEDQTDALREPAVVEIEPDRPSLAERRAARRAAREQERLSREEAPQEEELPGIVASITELREHVPNAWRITLDNGEVWLQVEPKPYRLRTGMQVRVYPTNWGPSHRLTGLNLNGFIRVQQVR